MATPNLSRLDKLDLSNMTVADIQGMKDDALRKTLMEAVENDSNDLRQASHQNHGSHGDHSTSLSPEPGHEDPEDPG